MFRRALKRTAEVIPEAISKFETLEAKAPTIKNIAKGVKAGALMGTGVWTANKLNKHPGSLKLHESALFGATFFGVTALVASHPVIAASAVAGAIVASDIADDYSIISIKKPGKK